MALSTLVAMTRLKSVARLVSKALALLVAIVVMLYLVINIAGLVSARSKRAAVSDQITQRISAELTQSQQRADAVADRVETDPTHAWTAQQCGFSTNDAGWIVQDHREVCTLETARAWKVSSEVEARALLGGLVQAGTKPMGNEACRTYEVSHSIGEQDVFADSQMRFLYVGPASEGSRYCDPTESTFEPRRSISGKIPTLDPSHGWLVVMQTDDLVDEVIGCLHWSVILCDNPFGDDPAWGKSPS